MKTQGNERITEIYNIVGAPEKPVADGSRPYGPIVNQTEERMTEVTYAGGRTVSLGNYEFVRILIGARVGVPADMDADAAFDAVRAFVDEVLTREEMMVRKRPYEAKPLENLIGERRAVWVEYGLTLNAKVKFESHKVDIGLSRPLGDDEQAEAVMTEMETYLAQRIDAERERLQGSR